MRAFVTGGTGFLGRNLVGQLLKKGYSVRCLARSPQKARQLPEEVEVVIGDIMDPKTLDPRYFKGIDVVFHVAGLISSYNPSDYFRVNVNGTKNLIKAILESENRVKFIYTSTLASVGPGKDSEPIKEIDEPHPVDFYGKSKREAEDYVLLHKNILNVSIIRPTAIYGSLDLGFLPLFQFR
jgi:Nucleoside-diphosphate-sugar epimerases